jgi:demethoxyubiquinone hydroxylase (CLK1/Coq7/Cat5 family)
MFRALLIKVPPVPFGLRYMSRSSPQVEIMIRVDHAGELGADRIYAGQMAVLGMQF